MSKKTLQQPAERKKILPVNRNILILFILGLFCFVLLFSVCIRQMSLSSFSDGTLGKIAYQYVSKLPFMHLEKIIAGSESYVLLEGETLKISFNFSSSDQEKIEKFSQNLGLDSAWSKGISITVDESSAQNIKSLIPALENGGKLKLGISLSEKSMEFTSQKLPLMTLLESSSNELASGSGKLQIQKLNPGYEIKIDNPADVLTEATMSGQLNLSEKINDDLWQLAGKFARIELRINGGNLNGKIYLK